MKKSLLFTALVMAIFMGVNAQELIVNGDFESGDLTGWGGYGNSVVLDGANNIGRVGNDGSFVQTVATENATQYTLKFKFRWHDDGSTPPAMNVTMRDARGNDSWRQKIVMAMDPSIVGEWQMIEQTFTTWNDMPDMKFTAWKPSGTHFDIDDVSFMKTVPTSIDQNAENAFSISPNPSNGIFKVTGEQGIASCSVYNTAGQLVNSISVNNQKQANIDMTGFKSGLYIVQVKTTSGQTSISKAIVK